jgi:hypothetical protein
MATIRMFVSQGRERYATVDRKKRRRRRSHLFFSVISRGSERQCNNTNIARREELRYDKETQQSNFYVVDHKKRQHREHIFRRIASTLATSRHRDMRIVDREKRRQDERVFHVVLR